MSRTVRHSLVTARCDSIIEARSGFSSGLTGAGSEGCRGQMPGGEGQGSRRVTVSSLSIERSNESTSPTPVASACAAR